MIVTCFCVFYAIFHVNCYWDIMASIVSYRAEIGGLITAFFISDIVNLSLLY